MIKSIELINFQRHKKLKLSLKDSFNCISGSNQRGKSSIVRGLYWLFTNSPAGDWMCRIDKNGNTHTATVKIVLDDDTVIKRIKGKTINCYTVDEKEFHSVGRNVVPEPVKVALGLDYGLLDEFKMFPYVLMQDEAIPDTSNFMVFNSETTVAGALNFLAGTNVIEKAVKDFNGDKLDISRKVRYNDEQKTKNETELKKYDVLEDVDFELCDHYHDSIVSRIADVDSIEKLYKRYVENIGVIRRYKSIRKILVNISVVDELILRIRDASCILNNIEKAVDWYSKFSKQKEPREYDFNTIYDIVSSIRKDTATANALQELYDRYAKAKGMVKSCEEELNVICEEFKKFKGVKCPLCNGIITGKIHG